MRAERHGYARALARVIVLGAIGGCYDLDPRLADAAAPPRDGCVARDGGCAEAPPAPCSEPDGALQRMRECDGSELTVCETDVHLDPRHCGECMKACDGMCWDGECHAIERLLRPASFFPNEPGAIAVARDYVYAMTESDGTVDRVYRETGEVEGFVDSLGAMQAIGVGSDRLYMLIEGTLWSKATLGAEAPQMMVSGVEAFAADKPVVAWVTTWGAVHQKSLLVGPTVMLGPDDSADLVDVGDGRTVAVKRSSADKPGYTLFVRPPDEARLDPIGEGDGSPRRVEVVGGSEVFVLSGTGSASEIKRFFIESEREPERYTASHDIVDFGADEDHLYVSWDNGSHGGIDALALQNRGYLMSTGFRQAPRQLVVDGGKLFFVEDNPRALSQVETEVLKRPL